MSIFENILSKLGFGKGADKPAPSRGPSVPDRRPGAAVSAGKPSPRGRSPISRPEAKARGIPVVDVVGKLEGMAAKNPQKLNWKVSIVDLLKLLDIDSSYEARKELAVELGVPRGKLGDSAEMNTWLHKAVLQKLADNGGNVPKELLV